MKPLKPESLQDLLTRPENLYAAWHKFLNCCHHDSILFDQVEVALFAANIDEELKKLGLAFKRLDYRMSPLRPMPFPKKGEPPTESTIRQTFWISVRDQVAWIALVNVIGPWIDAKMPSWSYGHRLYRSVWIDEVDGQPQLKIGWYRHAKGLLYRRFKYSWPLFRRHIFLTARRMGEVDEEGVPLQEADQRILKEETSLPQRYRLPYLLHNWDARYRQANTGLFWAGLDLEKFYPSLSLATIKDNLAKYSGRFQEEIKQLAEGMLTFRLNLCDWTPDELKRLGLRERQSHFSGIPTGLLVAGFLANVALLGVDEEVGSHVTSASGAFYQRIAHFRYVDDHIILATSFEDLRAWIRQYTNILAAHDTGCRLNLEKIRPIELEKVISNVSDKEPQASGNHVDLARKECRFDPAFPTPLMTQTLALVSQLARTEFLLLDDAQQTHFVQELEHLLLTEFPDEEIRRDTRMSFAASLLARYAPHKRKDQEGLTNLARLLAHLKEDIRALRNTSGRGGDSTKKEAIDQFSVEIADKEMQLGKMETELAKKNQRYESAIFQLLLRAVHEYPEKPRLWFCALDFLRSTGLPRLSAIIKELEAMAKANYLAAGYLRALLLQVLSRHLMKCGRRLSQLKSGEHEFGASLGHMNDILDNSSAFLGTANEHWFFLGASRQLFLCSVGTLISHLKSIPESNEIANFLNKACNIGQKLGCIDWTQSPREWAARTDYALDAWATWADLNVASVLSSEPSCIWQDVAKLGDLASSYSWHLLAEHPNRLGQEFVVKNIIAGHYKGKQPYINPENGGWLMDAIMPAYKQLGSSSSTLPRWVLSIQRALSMSHDDEMSLIEWANWTRERWTLHPHDPRVGEWMAVEIARQIAVSANEALFDKYHSKRWPYPINPYNVFIPRNWTDETLKSPSRIPSWGELSRLVADNPVRIKKRGMIRDDRYLPIWHLNPKLDNSWAPVHAIGLVLLGLLRRSFDWPRVWNRKGGRRDYGELAGAMVNQINCSSFTLAILEGSLLLRPKESVLIQGSLQERPPDDDTTFDPPHLQSISELLDYLIRSLEVLSEYQIMVYGNLPRQMVPVNLRQLCKPLHFLEKGETDDDGQTS